MADTRYTRRLRLTVLGCLLFWLVVIHVSVRYLQIPLSRFGTFGGVDPTMLSLIYPVSMIVLAVVAIRRQGTAGWLSGAGFLLFAVEPPTSTLIFGDGCLLTVSPNWSLLPAVSINGIAVGLTNASCGVSLNSVVLGLGVLCVAGGLWMGNVPAIALSRWRAVVDPYYPWC